MKSLLIASLGLALGTSAYGIPVTFNDPFGVSAYPATCGGNPQLCDVIGDASKFDIEKITGNVSTTAGNNSTFTIFTNFLGGSALSPTSYAGANLRIGDLLFLLGGDVKFGVVLNSHDGLATGGLYQVTNTFSSDTMMAGVNAIYRTGKQVLISPTGATLLGTGSINVATIGGNPTYLRIDITIPTPQSLATLFGDTWGISFASATCANDILEGSLTTPLNEVPEPSTYLLMGAGLIGLGFLRRKVQR